MLVGDRQLGRQVPTGLIDDQHRMGAGIDGGTDLDEVRRHGVGVAPGHDQPGALSPSRDRSRRRYRPIRSAGRRGARGRVPRLAHRRVSLFFWPSGLHLATTLYLDAFQPRPDLKEPVRRGSFF